MGTLSFLVPGLLFLCGVRGEVAGNFNNCNRFFFRGTPVAGLNTVALPTPEDSTEGPNKEQCLSAYRAASPAHICQKYVNDYYFATLYDRGRRIPLYSAYLVDREDSGREGDIVNYEPQLVHPDLPVPPDNPGSFGNQMNKKDTETKIRDYNNIHGCKEQFPQYRQTYKLTWSQALFDQFGTKVGYDRGHLNPPGHHAAGLASLATMTFTNIAPQEKNMNNGPWSRFEERVKKMKVDEPADCSRMYVVTGVVPSEKWVDQNRRVNVPSLFWSAYCCTDNNDVPKKSGGAVCPNKNVEVTEFSTVAGVETEVKKAFVESLKVVVDLHIFNNCVPRADVIEDREGSASWA